MNKLYLVPIIAILFTISSCGSGPQKETLPETEIKPDEQPEVSTSPLSYQGRMGPSNGTETVLIWQGTTIKTAFSGSTLKAGFSQMKGQVYFDIEIDGHTSLLTAKNGWIDIPVPTGDGTHTLSLFKRSEGDVGYVTFLGFKTSNDSPIIYNGPSTEPSNSDSRKFLFFGDSITAGACNEDGNEDQWEDYSTHNNALSYGAMTAETLDAEYRNISVSGMGITMGYNKLLFKEVWDRIYPDPTSDKVDFGLWQPDVIFTNFGENDDSFSNSENQPFPSNFTSEYVAVVKKIRNAYPNSAIVILRGGMYGGAQSERLRGPWNETVKSLKAGDNNIFSFAFDHWSSTHPRVSDHRILAKELSDWVNANL